MSDTQVNKVLHDFFQDAAPQLREAIHGLLGSTADTFHPEEVWGRLLKDLPLGNMFLARVEDSLCSEEKLAPTISAKKELLRNLSDIMLSDTVDAAEKHLHKTLEDFVWADLIHKFAREEQLSRQTKT